MGSRRSRTEKRQIGHLGTLRKALILCSEGSIEGHLDPLSPALADGFDDEPNTVSPKARWVGPGPGHARPSAPTPRRGGD